MPFELEPTDLDPVAVVTGRVFLDDRGSFTETAKQSEFDRLGLPRFVQQNQSRSRLGVLRGIHYQLEPHAQGKLVRVASGRIWDVAVDLRSSSPTFLQWFGMELTGDVPAMLWIPPGFGHGFVAMSEGAIVQYQASAEYHADSERSIVYDDPSIGIAWPDVGGAFVLSDKDKAAPNVAQADVFA